MSFDPSQPNVDPGLQGAAAIEGGFGAAVMRAGQAMWSEVRPDVIDFSRTAATVSAVGAAIVGVAKMEAGVAQASGSGDICETKMVGNNAVRGIKALYNGARTRLNIRAGVARYEDCDTDGPTRLNPSGDGDVGDRTFVVFRQSKNNRGRWAADTVQTRLTNAEVVGTPMKPSGEIVIGRGINEKVATPKCKKGTTYRGAVKVIWNPDEGRTVTRTFTGPAKKC